MKLIYENKFTEDTGDFKLEGKGSYAMKEGTLTLDDTEACSGLTLWLNRTFQAPIYILYEAEATYPVMANNINLFFMAATLKGDDILNEAHSGDYQEYHRTCRMYGFTFTGKTSEQSWTRLRKNPGFHLMSEDLNTVCKPHQTYRMEVKVNTGNIECRIDNKIVHRIKDSDIYTSGSIGFRTWHTKLLIRRFQVFSGEGE